MFSLIYFSPACRHMVTWSVYDSAGEAEGDFRALREQGKTRVRIGPRKANDRTIESSRERRAQNLARERAGRAPLI